MTHSCLFQNLNNQFINNNLKYLIVMLKNVKGVARSVKQVNKNIRMPIRWMFPSGVNYYAIADRAQHDAFPHD